MSALAKRRFFEQLTILVQKPTVITTIGGKTYSGILEGYDPDTLSICLSEVTDEKGDVVHRVFLSGRVVAQILSAKQPFDLKALTNRLAKVFPRMTKLYEEIGVIVVMDRIRVNETGIIEGVGPAAERVQKVYDEFIKGIKI